MIRLDRFLSNMGRGTRKEVKKMISEGAVTVNGIPAADCAMAVDEQNDQVFVRSERVFYRPFVYLMMNKPSGVLLRLRGPGRRCYGGGSCSGGICALSRFPGGTPG